MGGGAQLALERRSGWFRQLSITALPPRAFLWAKAAVIMLVVLPALVLVFMAGFVIGGVRAPVGAWLASLALMWLALIPMTILGIVVGLWVKGDAVQGLTTLLLLVLVHARGVVVPGADHAHRDADHRPHPALLLAGGARSLVRSCRARPSRGPAWPSCWCGRSC